MGGGVSAEGELRASHVSTPPVRGIRGEDWNELLAHGRRRRTLTAEEIVDVLHEVDLTTDAIEAVRVAIVAEGIEVDQSFEVDDSGELRRPLLDNTGDGDAPRRRAAQSTTSTTPSPSNSRRRADERDPDSLRLYLHEISRVPLLDAEGERRLARLIERGVEARRRLDENSDHMTFVERRQAKRDAEAGERARQDLITANLRLVVSIAKRFVRSSMPLADAVQSGNIGLIKAVERFDPSRGIQVLDLRHLVDPTGDLAGGRRREPQHPSSGAHHRAHRTYPSHRTRSRLGTASRANRGRDRVPSR